MFFFIESDFLKGSTSVEIDKNVCNESGSIPEEDEQIPQVSHEEDHHHYPRGTENCSGQVWN